MLKLYLVRHGESAWNQLRLYTGQQDVSLSELGMLQAARVAECLRELPVAELYTSPLRRAYDTAKPTAELKQLPLRADVRLAEIHHGAWEGNPVSTVSEQYAEMYAAWRAEPHTVTMPEGESLDDVAARVRSFLQDLFAGHSDGNIVIFTHDAVLRVFVMQLLGLGLEHFWRWRLDNASVSILERAAATRDSTGAVMPFRLASLNDVHHLSGLASDCETHAL